MKFKCKGIVCIILIVLALEVCVFNFNSFRTVFKKYEEIEYSPNEVILNDIKYNQEKDAYIITGNNPSIEIKDINTEVAAIRLKLELLNDEKLEYRIAYTDITSKNYRGLPTKVLVNGLEKSQYVTCYLSGESNKIRIDLSAENDTLEMKFERCRPKQKCSNEF